MPSRILWFGRRDVLLGANCAGQVVVWCYKGPFALGERWHVTAGEQVAEAAINPSLHLQFALFTQASDRIAASRQHRQGPGYSWYVARSNARF